MTVLAFDSARAYLEALAKNSDLAVVSVPMAADALDKTRAGTLLMIASGRLDEIKIDGTRCVRAQSLIDIENEAQHNIDKVTAKLEQIARKKTRITYEPIMKLVGLRNVSPDRTKIGVILARVSERSFKQPAPKFLISTLVCRSVNGKPEMPGDGYWPLAEKLLERRIKKEDRAEVFEQQLRAIYKHYAK